MYVRELHVQYRLREVSSLWTPPDRLLAPKDAALAFMHLLQHEAVEVCGMFCLSTRHHVLAYHELSRGTADAALVHPREVFKVALLANATALILGHYVARHIMRLMCPTALCGSVVECRTL